MSSSETKQDDGGPAFPSPTPTVYVGADGTKQATMANGEGRGMSLRDRFAEKVMQGLTTQWVDTTDVAISDLAKLAYKIADAMLKTRMT